MKKTALVILVLIGVAALAGDVCGRVGGGIYIGGGAGVPEVSYITPKADSEVDLTGKEDLVFRWKPTPIPSGDRQYYKFTLFKGFGYDLIFSKKLGPQIFLIKIPSEMFEDGETYTWQVKQRGWGGDWSRNLRWSFRVRKQHH